LLALCTLASQVYVRARLRTAAVDLTFLAVWGPLETRHVLLDLEPAAAADLVANLVADPQGWVFLLLQCTSPMVVPPGFLATAAACHLTSWWESSGGFQGSFDALLPPTGPLLRQPKGHLQNLVHSQNLVPDLRHPQQQ